MGVTKIDSKGRVVIPKDVRRKLNIKPGEEFLVTEIDGDTIVLRRFNVKKMLEKLVRNSREVNLEELEAETREEGNRVAKELYRL
ncbi:AbrB/MazE/SpoVT family DNA-binding domain-containing protein [Thermococcus nautili]|uniref:Transcription regulator, SpoVT/AbrB family n=1 Tax=Thermococcus nautili TaxID=195522 RepID=W8PJ72_9EURY|nr:AbrB/MazE/SpoVT family DNA-binding domain-containing protein [Thermococcus nautili]AHL22159.1 transcription regulator, SpoVT/AbrB family [Thermococcus nautili]NJE48615.1 AbrB/MazE/SpoVT family DNA-binding domain-containing protein [Thermococcus sp. 9N3]CAI1493792.1 Transcription regulator, SpoVT/AbrB family [Thermococcus nautili]